MAGLRPCGDDALILTRERSAFLRLAGGAELIAGAGLIGTGEVEGGVVAGDRLVVHRPGLMQVLDVGDAFGRLLWKHEGSGVPALTGDVVLVVGDDGVEARGLESGCTLWERLTAQHEGFQHFWCFHDRAGVVFHTWLETGARTTLLDPRTGVERWSVAHEPSEGAVALTPALVVVSDRDGQHLSAYSRGDGRLKWTAEEPPTDLVACFNNGPDAIYVAWAMGETLRLVVLDLATGAVRATATARLPAEAADGSAWPMWVRDGTVEVLVTTRSDLVVIVRFAD